MGLKSLQAWLSDLETRHTTEIQLGLTRISQVAEKLNLTHFDAVVITVAGTNGKGSTVAALESIYYQAGYQVASYTSPHLIEFNERIKINQKQIDDESLVKAFEIIDDARGEVHLTYFEVVTLAAFWWFKKHRLDVIILEVGLGGRLDATNIIHNDLAIITTIDFDHQAFLGNTLEAIGFEKAGIIKPKSPCIYADRNMPLSILNQARQCQSSLYQLNVDYDWQIKDGNIIYMSSRQSLAIPKSNLHPNALSAAIKATELLTDRLPVSINAIENGLKQIKINGRLQVLNLHDRTIILDVSHNPQSVKYLADFLAKQSFKSTHAVFSALADKDISEMLTFLRPFINHWYPALLGHARALSAEQLLIVLNDNEINVNVCHNSPRLAYQAAYQQTEAGDLILVFGSFFTVSDVLWYLKSGNHLGDKLFLGENYETDNG